MRKSTVLTIIYALVTVLGLGIIIYYFMFMKDKDDYKLYTNKQYGFSIKYPQDWYYKEKDVTEKGLEGLVVQFYSPLEGSFDFYPQNVSIIINPTGPHETNLTVYTEIALRQMQGVFKEGVVIHESVDHRLAGMPGHKVVYELKAPEGSLKMLQVWTLFNKTAYQVNYAGMGFNFDEDLEKAQRMINSFKLLK